MCRLTGKYLKGKKKCMSLTYFYSSKLINYFLYQKQETAVGFEQ